jgi:hypothetical protein
MKKSLILTFWALVGTFLFIASQFFVPVISELIKGSIVFLLSFFIFFLLGILLIYLTLRQKVGGILKRFLILIGSSATGFFVFVFLHNFFYGLGIIANQIPVLRLMMEILHAAFFIIAIFVCPLGFVIGVIGTIVVFIKKKKNSVL